MQNYLITIQKGQNIPVIIWLHYHFSIRLIALNSCYGHDTQIGFNTDLCHIGHCGIVYGMLSFFVQLCQIAVLTGAAAQGGLNQPSNNSRYKILLRWIRILSYTGDACETNTTDRQQSTSMRNHRSQRRKNTQ